jgi:hypothetical protein
LFFMYETLLSFLSRALLISFSCCFGFCSFYRPVSIEPARN